MSGFMKSVSNFWQNFRPSLRVAFAVLTKAGAGPSKRVGSDSPVAWLQADTKWGPQTQTLGEWGGPQREAFSSVKGAYFLCRIALASPALQPKRPPASPPDTSKLGK